MAIAGAVQPATFDPTKLTSSYCVEGTDGSVGLWNSSFLQFADLGKLHYVDANGELVQLSAANLAWKSKTELWVVTTEAKNNVYQWSAPSAPSPSNGWASLSQLGTVRSLAFDSKGNLFAVIPDSEGHGQVMSWGTYSWQPGGYPSDWDVKMIAFQGTSAVWCVANTEGGGTCVAQWNADYQRWASLGEISDSEVRKIEMIAFDQGATPSLWAVDDKGTIAYWEGMDPTTKKYVEQWIEPPDTMNLPNIAWLAWQPSS